MKQKNEITISLIIPVYNAESYLRKCIDSVFNQVYVPDQIILVDDGSTDDSPKICDDYANDNSIVEVIHKKNEGLGFARNTGLEAAWGDYVAFLDSDDYLDADFFTVMKSAVNNGTVDLVKSGYRRISKEGKVFYVRSYESDEIFCNKEIKTSFIPRTLGSLPREHDSIEMGVTCSLIKRKCIMSIRFPSEKEYISEDLIFNMQLFENVNIAKVLHYVGYNYLENTSSLSLKYREDRFNSICVLNSKINEYIERYRLTYEARLRWNKTWIIYLWMTISQEKYCVSGLNFFIESKNIRDILNSPVTINIVNNYPVEKLERPKRVFLKLVKNRMVLALLVLIQILNR